MIIFKSFIDHENISILARKIVHLKFTWHLAIFNYSRIDGKLLEQKQKDFGKEWDGGGGGVGIDFKSGGNSAYNFDSIANILRHHLLNFYFNISLLMGPLYKLAILVKAY